MRIALVMVLPGLLAAGCTPAPPVEQTAQPAQRFICDRSQSFTVAFTGDKAVMTAEGGEVQLASQPVGAVSRMRTALPRMYFGLWGQGLACKRLPLSQCGRAA